MFGSSVTLASTDNALPEDGVPKLKHVGAVLMYILMFFKTITCALNGELKKLRQLRDN